ncbi:MAG: YdcF family protein [Nanoarchaeota archaeon]|nr:YdcF family protein [Nanoarchaeota archaeon]MBU0977215.1 YdcF family protein [Nanoarchaeota archaeon]
MRPLVDSIIVHGNPSPRVARERADAAYRVVWKQNGLATNRSKLIVVATGGGEPGNCRSSFIVWELKRLGVPEDQIRQEFSSGDTLDSIRNGLGLCEGRVIGFASNPHHLRRVRYLFEGLKMEGAIDGRYVFVPIESRTSLRDAAYELFAMPLTMLRTFRGFRYAHLNSGGFAESFGRSFYPDDGNGNRRAR